MDATEITHERVVITRNGKPIAADDLESLEETIAVLCDPQLMATLREFEAEVDAGRAIPLADYLAAHRAAAANQ